MIPRWSSIHGGYSAVVVAPHLFGRIFGKAGPTHGAHLKSQPDSKMSSPCAAKFPVASSWKPVLIVLQQSLFQLLCAGGLATAGIGRPNCRPTQQKIATTTIEHRDFPGPIARLIYQRDPTLRDNEWSSLARQSTAMARGEILFLVDPCIPVLRWWGPPWIRPVA